MGSRPFSEYNVYYKFNVVIAWTLSFFVIVLNAYAIFYLATKKHRLVYKNRMKKRRHRFSVYSRIDKNVYKPDEVIVLSLCFSNFGVGLAAGIKFLGFVTESWNHRFDAVISYIVTFAMFVSLIHILLLSLERLLSIRSPFCHSELQNKQTLYMLLMVWLMSILPPILNQNPSFSLLIAALIIQSYIILTITYAFIFQAMAKAFASNTNSTISDDYTEQKRQKMRERRTTFSCCSIVISYVICTIIPVIRLLTAKKGINHLESTTDVLMFIFLLLRSISDPLVYILRNKIYNLGMYFFRLIRSKKYNSKLCIDKFSLNLSDEDEIYILLIMSRETSL